MSITSTNYTDISYDLETVPGTTNATPDFQLLPTTGGSPMSNITTAVSEVIRSDRQIDDLVVVDSEISGEVSYELSYTPFKPILTSLMRNDSPVALSWSGSDVTVDDSGKTFTTAAGDFTTSSNLEAGGFVKFSGFTEAGNNKIYKISSITTTVITVEDPDNTLVSEASGDSVSVTGSKVTNAADAADTYTFMKRVQGISSTAYFYYRGCAISSASLNFETGSILGGNFGIYGRSEEATESAIAGQTITDVPSYDLLNSVSSISRVVISGIPSTTTFSSLNLNINNNTTGAKGIGTLGAVDVTDFVLDVGGDISLYFEDIVAYNSYVNSSSFQVDLLLDDSSGNAMAISMPKCKFESLEKPIEGKDNFFMLDGTFKALRDATSSTTLELFFFDA